MARLAQKCPLCEGYGERGPQCKEGKCNACGGTGLLWSGYDEYHGPTVAPFVQPAQPMQPGIAPQPNTNPWPTVICHAEGSRN